MNKVSIDSNFTKLGMLQKEPLTDGISGNLGFEPEDFIVQEVPLYEPMGSGEHCYYTLEKRNRTTMACISELAKYLNISEVDIGYAGLKDKHAVTSQMVSIRMTSKDAPEIKTGGFTMKFLGRHQNKIKIGHLKGNRFILNLENLEKNYQEKLEKKLAAFRQVGFPNYFGFQRFGSRLNNHLAGISVLKKDFKEACRLIIGDPTNEANKQAFQAREYFEKGDLQKSFDTFPLYFFNERKMIKELQKGENKEKRAYLKCDRKTREILFNASQSYLFNLVASERINRGLQIFKGDVALLASNLAPFIVEDPVVENIRLASGEIHIGGPLFGFKMIPARDEPLAIEDQVLADAGVTREDFASAKDEIKFQGSRRPIMVKIPDISYEEISEDKAKLSFFLSSGSYATVVLQEIFRKIQVDKKLQLNNEF